MYPKREIEYGKVIEYDGYNGTIKGEDGNTYIVMDKDIVNKEILHPNDQVKFDKECISDLEIDKVYVARFVKILKK